MWNQASKPRQLELHLPAQDVQTAILCVFAGVLGTRQSSGIGQREACSMVVSSSNGKHWGRVEFSILGGTVEKNDSHWPGISQIVAILVIAAVYVGRARWQALYANLISPCNHPGRQRILFYREWMRNLKSGDLLEVTRWQVLELNPNPTHSLSHQGLTNWNLPECTRAETTRAQGNPEIIWTDQPDSFKPLFSEKPERKT